MRPRSEAWAARGTAFGVAAAAVAMVALDLGRRILATNDEARFPLLAQDVMSRGHWMAPQLNGASYSAKPPLAAWLIALASSPAGHVTQLTAVVPSALAGVGTALIVFWLGRRLFGSVAGAFAALAVVTTQGWFLHARLPMPDMLVAFFVTAAVAMLWPMTQGRRGAWWLGFYGSMVGAFWSKGAVALLPLAAALAWGIVTRRAGWWRALRLPEGLVLFAVLVAPWWIGKVASDSAEMRHLVVWDNLLWYLPRSLEILVGPPQHIVGILFPWVLVIPFAVWRAARVAREGGRERDALVFVLVWAGALLCCLGISDQQRLRYYLPLISPGALLIGWWAARTGRVARTDGGPPWRVYVVVGLVVAAATGLAVFIRPTWSTGAHVAFPASATETAVMAAGIVVMVAALAYGIRRDRVAQVFVVACAGAAVWVMGWYHWELLRRNAAYDYPRVRAEARRLLPESPVMGTWGVYDLPLSFYFGRRVASIGTDGDFTRLMTDHPRASAVLTESALAQVGDRTGLRVLPLDRLNFDRIVLVSYSHDQPESATRR